MSRSLTFGLVQIYKPDETSLDKPDLLGQVEGTYTEGYRCTHCKRFQAKEGAATGSIWRCDNCDDAVEESEDYDTYEGACCSDYEQHRLDGNDGTVEGIVCQLCSAAPQEAVELFSCAKCKTVMLEEDAESHLYEELKNSWQ